MNAYTAAAVKVLLVRCCVTGSLQVSGQLSRHTVVCRAAQEAGA